MSAYLTHSLRGSSYYLLPLCMVYQSVLFQIAQSCGKLAQDEWNAWVDRLNDVQPFCLLR